MKRDEAWWRRPKIDVKKAIIRVEASINQLEWASKPSKRQKTNPRSNMNITHTQAVTVLMMLRIHQLREYWDTWKNT